MLNIQKFSWENQIASEGYIYFCIKETQLDHVTREFSLERTLRFGLMLYSRHFWIFFLGSAFSCRVVNMVSINVFHTLHLNFLKRPERVP